MNQRLWLQCDHCGFKKIVDNNTTDVELSETLPLQLTLPKLNVEGQVIAAKFVRNQKKTKCRCGRTLIARQLPDAFAKSYEKKDLEQARLKEQADRLQRFQDGTSKDISKDEENN